MAMISQLGRLRLARLFRWPHNVLVAQRLRRLLLSDNFYRRSSYGASAGLYWAHASGAVPHASYYAGRLAMARHITVAARNY